MQSRSPVAAQWRCASGETAARCGAAARRCSPARRWRRARPGRGSGSGGSWRGFPRASGSLERDPPSTAAAHRASPEGRIIGGDRGRDTEVFSTQVTKAQVFQEVSSAFTQSILYLKYLLILKQVWVTETKYSQEASKMKKIRCNTMIQVIQVCFAKSLSSKKKHTQNSPLYNNSFTSQLICFSATAEDQGRATREQFDVTRNTHLHIMEHLWEEASDSHVWNTPAEGHERQSWAGVQSETLYFTSTVGAQWGWPW